MWWLLVIYLYTHIHIGTLLTHNTTHIPHTYTHTTPQYPHTSHTTHTHTHSFTYTSYITHTLPSLLTCLEQLWTQPLGHQKIPQTHLIKLVPA